MGITTAAMDTTFQQLANFRGLTSLVIHGNSMTGTLPSSIGLLTNLQYLYLCNSIFTKLPTEIGQLGKLTYLDLSTGKLKGIPTEMGRLKSLQSLSLYSNSLSGTIPSQLLQLWGRNLKHFLVYQNKLTGPIGFASFCNAIMTSGQKDMQFFSSGQDQNNFCYQSCMFPYFTPTWNYNMIWGSNAGLQPCTTNNPGYFNLPMSYYPATSFPTGFSVTRGNLVGAITLPSAYTLSFDVKPQTYDGAWRSLIHLSGVSATSTSSDYRSPGVFFCNTGAGPYYGGVMCPYLGLMVSFNMKANSAVESVSPALTVNVWYTVTIKADFANYVQSIGIKESASGGAVLLSPATTLPTLSSSPNPGFPVPVIFVYASDPWFPEAPASIRNLAISSP